MPIQAKRLLNHRSAEIRRSYERRDAILPAPGLGLAQDSSATRGVSIRFSWRLQVKHE
jgi:hypothetical protein